MESIHYEPYSGRIQKRGKTETAVSRLCQQKRERSISRNRPITPHNINLPIAKAKSSNARQSGDLKSDSGAPSIIHRELYTDNPALVEVTVKTHNANPRSQINSRSNSRSRSREPWSKLLKQHPSNEHLSSFHNFDPLRTIHFLAKELQSKLGDSSMLQKTMRDNFITFTFLDDRTVQQMVSEMQQALNRIPPEVASTVLIHGPRDHKKPSVADVKLRPKTASKENEEPPEDKLLLVVKPPSKEVSCQTPKNNYEPERLQKHLEESSAKIETACKQMEAVCTRLKCEKEELEIMLRAERETVKFLRKQMEEFDTEKVCTNCLIINLKIHAKK